MPKQEAMQKRGEREEELALFHEVRRREHERKSNAIHPLPLHDADQLHLAGSADALMQQQIASCAAKMTQHYASNNRVVNSSLTADLNGKSDDLLSAELSKNDYDWLLTPPGTPSFNKSNHNSASNHGDFLSRAEPLSLVQSLAAIKTSRFSSSQIEPNLRKDGATLLSDPELASTKGQNGVSRFNGSPGSYVSTLTTKKTPLTPRSGSTSRPTSPTRRTTVYSAHKSNPTTPTNKTKPSSAPGSHPTTPTSKHIEALASKGGGNSVSSSSTTTKKTGSYSHASTSTKRLSPSAGVSRSSSASRVRPQPSRSAPSSRGSSPTANPHNWQQAFSSNSQSTTTAPTVNSRLRSNIITPTSLNSRGSLVGSSHRQGVTASTKQAHFSAINQLETFMDIPKKSGSPSLTRGKCALLKMDRQSSAGSIMSRNSIQVDKCHGDSVMGSIKMEDKIVQARQSLGSSVSPDIFCSVVQANHSQDKYVSPTSHRNHGFSKHTPRRSLDTNLQHLNNGLCSGVTNKPGFSFSSSKNVERQNSSNSFLIASNCYVKADFCAIASHGQDSSKQGEESIYRSDFKVLQTDQTDILSSFVKDEYMSNWLDSPEFMNEGLDPMEFFEQGMGKFGSCESPLVCPHGGGAVSCDLCSVKMRLQMLNEKSKASFGANSQILSEA